MNERIVIEIVGKDKLTRHLKVQQGGVKGLSMAFAVLGVSLDKIQASMNANVLATQRMSAGIQKAIAGISVSAKTSAATIPAAVTPALKKTEAKVAIFSKRVRAMMMRAFSGAGVAGGRGLSIAGGTLGGILGGLGGSIGGIGGGGGGGSNLFSGLIKGATNASRSIVEALTAGISQGVQGIGKLIGLIPKFLGSVLSGIPKFGQVLAAPFKLASGAIEGFTSLLSGLVSFVGGVAKAVVGVAGTALNALVSVASSIVSKVAGVFSGLVSKVAGIFGKIASTAGLALGAIVTVATIKSLGFRKQMARAFGLIAVDLKKAGQDGGQAIRREFFQIARDVLADAGTLKWANVGKAVYDTISAGFRTAQEAKPILEAAGVATLASGGDDPAPFVKALTKALTQFELPASRAREVADKFFQTVNFGVITIEELAEVLPGVGAVARSAGLDLERTLTLIAEATKRLDLETSSSGLQQFLLSVAAPGPEAMSARQKFGIETEKLSPAQTKQAEALRASIKAYEGFIQKQSEAEKSTHKSRLAVKEAKKDLKSLRSELVELRRAGDAIDPIEFLRKLQDLDLSAAQLKKVVGGRVQAFRFAAAFTGGKAADEAGLKPDGAGAGLDNFAKTEEEIRNRSRGAADAAAGEMRRSLSVNLSQLMTNIGLLWDTVMGRIEEKGGAAFASVHESFDGFRMSVEDWVQTGGLDDFFEDVGSAASATFEFLGNLIGSVSWDEMKQGGKDAWDVISTVGKATWEGLKMASKLAGVIMSGNVTGPLGAAFDFVGQAGEKIWNAIVGLSAGDSTGFAAIFKRLEGFFLRVVSNVGRVVGKIIDGVLEATAVVVETIGGGVNETIAAMMKTGAAGLLEASGAIELDRDFTGAIGAAGDIRGARGKVGGDSLGIAANEADKAAAGLESLHREALRAAAASKAKADADRNAVLHSRESRRAQMLLDASEKKHREERLARQKAADDAFFGPESSASPKVREATRDEKERTQAAKDGAAAGGDTAKGVASADAKLAELVRMAATKKTGTEASKTIEDLKHKVRLAAAPTDAIRKAIEREKQLNEIRKKGGEEAVRLAKMLFALQDAKAKRTGKDADGINSRDPDVRRRARRARRQNRKSGSAPTSPFGRRRAGLGIGGGIFGTFRRRPTLVETEEKQIPFFGKSAKQRATEKVTAGERARFEQKIKERQKESPTVTSKGGVPAETRFGPKTAEEAEALQKETQRRKGESDTTQKTQTFKEVQAERKATVERKIREETERIKKRDRQRRDFVTEFSGPGAAGGLKREGSEDRKRRKERARKALEALGVGKKSAADGVAAPDTPGEGSKAEEAPDGKTPKAAEGMAESSTKAAEAAKAAQDAIVESLEKSKTSIDDVGKGLEGIGTKLKTGLDALTAATTGVLKEHTDRLATIEETIEDQTREREALQTSQNDGAGG